MLNTSPEGYSGSYSSTALVLINRSNLDMYVWRSLMRR